MSSGSSLLGPGASGTGQTSTPSSLPYQVAFPFRYPPTTVLQKSLDGCKRRNHRNHGSLYLRVCSTSYVVFIVPWIVMEEVSVRDIAFKPSTLNLIL